jgi:hypothetical protein
MADLMQETPKCQNCQVAVILERLIKINKELLNVKERGKIKKEVFDKDEAFYHIFPG